MVDGFRYRLLTEIDDLRLHSQAEPFWKTSYVLRIVEYVHTGNPELFGCSERDRLRMIIQSLKHYGYNPPAGREIMARVSKGGYIVVDGWHRISILYAWDMPIPCLLLERC